MDEAQLGRLYLEHVAALQRAYEALLVDTKWDAVLIHSGSALPKTMFDDQSWSLRATPHFQHWLPLPEGECALLVRGGKKPVLFRPSELSFWESPPPPEVDFFWASFERVDIERWEDVEEHLPQGRVAFIGDNVARAASLGFGDERKNPTALLAKLDALRTLKTAYEIECLAEANRRAALGHVAVRDAFFAGETSELALHLRYLGATSQDDPETPYKNIIAAGPHGATLHHVSYRKDASGAPSLLVDAGATCLGYCSDITRTWVREASAASSAFLGMVQSVEDMQKRLAKEATTGRLYEELHDESHRGVAMILRDVGLVKLSTEEIDVRGISRVFYPHGLGHSLGLQCHDVGCATTKPREDNPFLRNTSRITAGQVFTIEPGIYFIAPLLAKLRQGPHADAVDWKLVDAMSGFGGVRIEDDVVVSPEGPVRNLTREVLPLGGGAP